MAADIVGMRGQLFQLQQQEQQQQPQKQQRRWCKLQQHIGGFPRLSWALFVLVVLVNIKDCSGTGHIEVRFMSYSDSCRELMNKCDPYFQFCLSRPQHGTLSVSSSRCEYAATGSANGHYHNTNHLDFSSKTSILGHSNPWVIQVRKFYDSNIMLVTNVRDADKWSKDDHMHTWGANLHERVWPSKDEAHWETRTSKSSDHSLTFNIRLYCDPNYYTSACDVYCVPRDSYSGHYTCDQTTGRKICLEGWKGTNCNLDVDECEDPNFCSPGKCTNLLGSFKCDCPKGFSGDQCKTRADPCLSSPCQNGVCFSHPSRHDFVCNCNPGWEGSNCGERRNPCKDKPCANDGRCVSNEMKTSYRCECRYPYGGPKCNDVFTTTPTTPLTTTTTTTPSTPAPTTTPSPNTTTTLTSTTTAATTTVTSTTTTTTTTTTPTTIVPVISTTKTPIPTTTTVPPTTTTAPSTVATITTTATSALPIEILKPAAPGAAFTDTTRFESTTTISSFVDQGIVAKSEQRNTDESAIKTWHIELMSGLLLLMIIVVVIIFLFKRRRRKRVAMRTLSVSYDRDNMAFINDIFVTGDDDGSAGIVPGRLTMADNFRELPPVPAVAAPTQETDTSTPQPQLTDVDETLGAVGGCKPVGKKENPEMLAKVADTLMRHNRGRAESNDYADFRSLNMRNEETDVPEAIEANEEESERKAYNPYEDIDAVVGEGEADFDLTEDEPHYNTLDEMNDYLCATEIEDSTVTTAGTVSSESCTATVGEKQVTTPGYAVINEGDNIYEGDKGINKEYTRVNNGYAVPKDEKAFATGAAVTNGCDVKEENRPAQPLDTASQTLESTPYLNMSSEAADPTTMYDSLPVSSIEYAVPPPRIRREQPPPM